MRHRSVTLTTHQYVAMLLLGFKSIALIPFLERKDLPGDNYKEKDPAKSDKQQNHEDRYRQFIDNLDQEVQMSHGIVFDVNNMFIMERGSGLINKINGFTDSFSDTGIIVARQSKFEFERDLDVTIPKKAPYLRTICGERSHILYSVVNSKDEKLYENADLWKTGFLSQLSTKKMLEFSAPLDYAYLLILSMLANALKKKEKEKEKEKQKKENENENENENEDVNMMEKKEKKEKEDVNINKEKKTTEKAREELVTTLKQEIDKYGKSYTNPQKRNILLLEIQGRDCRRNVQNARDRIKDKANNKNLELENYFLGTKCLGWKLCRLNLPFIEKVNVPDVETMPGSNPTIISSNVQIAQRPQAELSPSNPKPPNAQKPKPPNAQKPKKEGKHIKHGDNDNVKEENKIASKPKKQSQQMQATSAIIESLALSRSSRPITKVFDINKVGDNTTYVGKELAPIKDKIALEKSKWYDVREWSKKEDATGHKKWINDRKELVDKIYDDGRGKSKIKLCIGC